MHDIKYVHIPRLFKGIWNQNHMNVLFIFFKPKFCSPNDKEFEGK
jgi:hypothetical protein